MFENLNMSFKNNYFLGSLLAALGVAIGAFGAHALGDFLEETQRTATFETAVRYQFYHALGLLFIGLIQQINKNLNLRLASLLMLIGTLIFSFSLYALCLSQIKVFGAITPIGGLLLIASWMLIFVKTLKYFSRKKKR